MRGKIGFQMGVLILLLVAACRSPRAIDPPPETVIAVEPATADTSATDTTESATQATAMITATSAPPDLPSVTATGTPSPTPTATPPGIPLPSSTPELPIPEQGGICVPVVPAGWEEYVVQSGDTINRLAQCSGAPPAQIGAANCLANPNLIFRGDRLFLPPGCGMAAPVTEQPSSIPPVYIDAPPPGECPNMTLAPTTGPAGTWITLTHTDFQAGETVEITFAPHAVSASQRWTIVNRVDILSEGQIIARIPSGESDHEAVWITVVMAGGSCTEASFELAQQPPAATSPATAAPTPSPTLPAPTETATSPSTDTATPAPTETAPPTDTPVVEPSPTQPATGTPEQP